MAKTKPAKISVESGVPLPQLRMRFEDYPFDELKKDDSFLVPHASLKAVRNAARRAAREMGCKLVVRKVDDGVRVWRTT